MGLATFITPLAKGLVDEIASYYAGVYIGKNSQTSVLKRIEEADAVFRVGYFPTDSNTGGFSSNIPVDRLIDLNMGTATIFGQDSQTVNQFGHVLVSMERASQPRLPVQIGKPSADLPVASESTISQAYL